MANWEMCILKLRKIWRNSKVWLWKEKIIFVKEGNFTWSFQKSLLAYLLNKIFYFSSDRKMFYLMWLQSTVCLFLNTGQYHCMVNFVTLYVFSLKWNTHTETRFVYGSQVQYHLLVGWNCIQVNTLTNFG